MNYMYFHIIVQYLQRIYYTYISYKIDIDNQNYQELWLNEEIKLSKRLVYKVLLFHCNKR